MDTDTDERAALLALTEAATKVEPSVPWHELAALVEESGSPSALLSGDAALADSDDASTAKQLAHLVNSGMVEHWRQVISRTTGDGTTRLLTVLDAEYPDNLRQVYNHPPFLFVRGRPDPRDARSLAVVGTRRPSPEGRHQAARLAHDLARRGVTVVSGLAAGIDTAAHTAALEAGGRTIAVMGTGIDLVYPKENAPLARRIATGPGALISQFWPGAPPRSQNFPLRNVVTSGLALGTVVVEASHTSGARMQARLALEHGKRVLLVRSLVMQEEWAQKFAQRRGVRVVESVDEVLPVVEAELEMPQKLPL